MGASERVIKDNKPMFECMVEFIGYRIYYNLSSWYKMLSFFPAHKLSSEFMEKMMGVKIKKTFDNKEENTQPTFFRKKFIYLPKTVYQFFRISITFGSLKFTVPRFNSYFNKVYSKLNSIDLTKLNTKELMSIYNEAAKKLLSRWRAPIANDFAVMVSTGAADKLFKSWLNSSDAYMYMRSDTNTPLVTLDPGKKLANIVSLIKENPKLKKLFSENEPHKIVNSLENIYSEQQVSVDIRSYIENFGTRIPNELKLESETLNEKPENLILLLQSLLQVKSINKKISKNSVNHNKLKSLNLFRRIFLKWLLKWADNSIKRREESRFKRTLIFGLIREIFINIGIRFEKEQIINNKRDIYFLRIDEIFDIINGNKKIDTLRCVTRRKKEFNKWGKIDLAHRFETIKTVMQLEKELLKAKLVTKAPEKRTFIGRVASRPVNTKVVTGVSLSLMDFDPTADFEGKILVTRQTDPGWTIVFPLLRGIVVERGGMLSHAAIVARELNIPCIVGVEKITSFIKSGMEITLDLHEGKVKI